MMLYIVVVSAAVSIISMMDRTGTFLYFLSFDAYLIVRGELWRLITWIFFPVNGGLLLTALALYFYYFIGSTLEREWGTPKFTIYYISGVITHILFGFVIWIIFGLPNYILTPIYLNFSMFFAFAVLFPDNVVRLYFIIPIKIKWLALANAAFFTYSIVSDLIKGYAILALLPLVALLNFFVICGEDLLGYLRTFRARTSSRTIKFKSEARRAQREQESAPYRHRCAVCGRTDINSPGLEFRYCSRCNGYHCFCIDHINNHVHFQ